MAHRLAVIAALLIASSAAAQSAPDPLTPARDVFQQSVAWSPDGRFIVFSQLTDPASYDPANWSMRVVSVEGSNERTVIGNAMWPTWAPDGAHLAFQSTRDGESDLNSIAADGSDLRSFTNDPARDIAPAWSPDGRRLAFSSDRRGSLDIWTLDAITLSATRLTRDEADDYNPQWSPDGSEIVFYREKGDGMDQIHVVRADGSDERRITNDTANNVFPSFTPEGRIVFMSAPKEGKPALIRVAADGSQRETVDLGKNVFFARWSPDGSRIAFIAGRWPRSAIYIKDANDGDGSVRKIVN